jgi:hypothetical protein
MNAIVGIGSQWGGTADTQIQVHWNETHYLPINDLLGGYYAVIVLLWEAIVPEW